METDLINLSPISIQPPRMITHPMKTITGIDPDNQTKDQVGHHQITSIKVAVIETGTGIESRQGNRAIAIMKSRTKDQIKPTADTMTNIMIREGLCPMLIKSTYAKGVLKATVTKGDLSLLP